MKWLAFFGFFIVSGLLCGCFGPSRKNPQPPPVSASQTETATAHWSDTTRAELEQGRAVVVSSCIKCHGYPSPGDETPAEWPAVAKQMSKKAKLDAAQTRAVVRYLVSASEVDRHK